MDNLSPEVLARVRPSVRQVTEISPGRYVLELSLEQTPERLLGELLSTGATVVSLNPLRDTLEDFFMQRVAEAGPTARTPSETEASSARH